jgi:peptidoglycan/LPS O-acetylase OafA/YrhL
VQNLDKAGDTANILGPLWSLPWEMQMYFVLPIFFVIFRRFQWLGTVFLLWLGAALLAVVGTLPQIHHGGAIFPPMFIGGMVAYQLLVWRQSQDRFMLPAWAWPPLVISLFVLPSVLVGANSLFSPVSALVYACNCLLIGLAIPFFRDLSWGWIVRPAEQIAKYSYGIYLLHVPAIVFCFRFFPGLPLAIEIVLALALTALISFVSFHVLEDPLIQLGKRLTRAKQPAPVAV